MYVKVHKLKYENIVALCDKELIGKLLEEKNLQLNITERFYKGEELPEDEIILLLKNSTNINIVGEKSINLALKSGIIDKENIIKIQGVPHAQFAQIRE